MAIKIVNVKLTTDYDWSDVKNMTSWNAFRNANKDWQQPHQTTTVGELVHIEVEVSENKWDSIKENHLTWQAIKDKFASWLSVKNY